LLPNDSQIIRISLLLTASVYSQFMTFNRKIPPLSISSLLIYLLQQ